jgi:predicted nucleic acid-binding protein
VFFDTSVLIGGLIELHSGDSPAQVLFTALAGGRIRGAATAWHCCLEFYSVSTRLPEEYRLSPEEAFQLLDTEVFARLRILELPKRAQRTLLLDAGRDRILGGRIYDAHIAAVARHGGAKIVVTENRRHFTLLLRHGIRVLTAAEALVEL